MEPLWSIRETADYLNCSHRHVQRLVAADLIPYGRVGNVIRFEPRSVRDWVMGEWENKGGGREVMVPSEPGHCQVPPPASGAEE